MHNDIIYFHVTKNCNLKCPHCIIYDNAYDNYNKEKVHGILRDHFLYSIILFGGEPLLYPERIENIINDKLIQYDHLTLISNLLLIDNIDKNILKNDIRFITTSWTPKRFTDIQYKKWLDNLYFCSKFNNMMKVIVTITPDILDYGIDNVLSIIEEWPDNLYNIEFGLLIPSQRIPGLSNMTDDFLYNLLKKWKFKIPLCNEYVETSIFKGCRQQTSLYPDGTYVNSCVHHNMKHNVLKECFGCKYNTQCLPCVHQYECPRPHKFIKLIDEMKNNNEINIRKDSIIINNS